ncbi:MAG: cytochrome c oxidase assembly protein [Candidatus Competibacterales bacterium]
MSQPFSQRKLVALLTLAPVVMFGFGFALVPLYEVICDIAFLNGKTNDEPAVIAADQSVAVDRRIKVQFLVNLNAGAPWQVAPEMATMEVVPGRFYQTHFTATNTTGHTLTGQAVPSVVPWKSAPHFQKIECFCFERQDFGPRESKSMPLAFRVDPELAEDIHTITLSYTFFRVDQQRGS